MNLVGKIFVVLIFAMSLIFMAFAVAVYGTHQNWKKVAQDAEAKRKTATELLTKAEAEKADILASIEREAKARREALAKLETERDELKKNHDEMAKQYSDLVAKDKEAAAALRAAHLNLEKLTAEVEGLRGEIRTAQTDRDKHFEQVVALTDKIHQVQGNVKRLEERRVQLAGQIAAQEVVLKAHNLSKDTPVDGIPPAIRGKVLAINRDNMIEISLGKDDGLREGHTLEVFRGSKYLGRVEILQASTDRAVGKILPAFKKGVIQKDDDVATRFKVG